MPDVFCAWIARRPYALRPALEALVPLADGGCTS